jgi:uncharacterized iron-regulated protein
MEGFEMINAFGQSSRRGAAHQQNRSIRQVIQALLLTFASLTSAVFWTGPAKTQETAFPIINIKSGETVSVQAFLDEIAKRKIILLGERHGFLPHQKRHAFILQALADRSRYPALVMEMINGQQAEIVNTYRSRSPENVSALGAELRWWETGWPAWSFYEPVFEAAFVAKLPIFGGEAPESTTSADHPPEIEMLWRNALDRAHCGLASIERLTEITRRQVARDRHMADQLAKATNANPQQGAVLIAGSAHVRRDRGVPVWLKDVDVVTVAFFALPSPAEHMTRQVIIDSVKAFAANGAADYVWVTPQDSSAKKCPNE